MFVLVVAGGNIKTDIDKNASGIKKAEKVNVFDEISAGDAFSILKTLAEEDVKIAERIEQIAMEYLHGVDIEDVADEVFSDLDCINVEDVWDQSGSKRDGYVDPNDKAWEFFEEALEPFLEKIRRYLKLSMYADAKNYCLGILKGIYMFENEATTEFADWVVDAPCENFGLVLNEWKEGQKNPKYVAEVEEYIKNNLPGML
ncbi:MAG: hypothetical protein DRN71_02330 [Candidatus Nanohalarchaeota archaeon]|nr:MAG: hypothetical protein DRN71_02330 [Candidatus Nanohaloarchaeota archaeon]